jgi:hypothetical protein
MFCRATCAGGSLLSKSPCLRYPGRDDLDCLVIFADFFVRAQYGVDRLEHVAQARFRRQVFDEHDQLPARTACLSPSGHFIMLSTCGAVFGGSCMTAQAAAVATSAIGNIGPIPSHRIPRPSWSGLFVGMVISTAIIAGTPRVLLYFEGRLRTGEINFSNFGFWYPFARCVFLFAIVAIISRLRPIWIGLLAGIFVAVAIVFVFLVSSEPTETRGLYLAGILPFFVVGLILAFVALVGRLQHSVGAINLVVSAIALVTLPSLAYIVLMPILTRQSVDLNTYVLTLFGWLIENFLPASVLLIFLSLYLPSVFRRRLRLKQAGLSSHGIAQFLRYGVDPASQLSTALKLDDNALFWAHALPDHTDDAKKIIGQELERRGHSRAELEHWTPDASDLAVPSAVDFPISPNKYVALLRSRSRYLWFYRTVVIWCISFFVGLWSLAFVIPRSNAKTLFAYIAAAGAAALFLAVGVRFRDRALRILLLRPFGEEKMTATLRDFVCENLGRIGYVFTLSDRHYKPSLLLRLGAELPAEFGAFFVIYVLGPLLRNSKRIASVKSERTFRKLQRKLLRQARPSFWSFLSGEQAFNIRSTDVWWQLCIQMLMHSCEIIVIDLSKVKAGTEWELKELHARSLLEKCIFVVAEANSDSAAGTLIPFFGQHAQPPVFVYRQNGEVLAKDAQRFADRLTRLMTAGLASWG